jgi:monothiol glutaredoxin
MTNDRQSLGKGARMTDIRQTIEDEVNGNPVLLFMKGTPVFPQCGFSAAVVQILSHLGVKYKAIDVLKDPAIRDGIKAYSQWPTIPQLYVKGEFVGGADIIREMFDNDELPAFFAEHGVALENA